MATPDYKIYIDTGGTFTDCIGVIPSGEVVYRKVLSSGCLRGEILEWVSGTEMFVKESWGLPPDLIRGFYFALTSNTSSRSSIVDYDPESGRLLLSDPLPGHSDLQQRAFEISTGEEAPVLGIRMITLTPLGGIFPSMEIRLGTTRGTNALLENKGADTLLITTSGFRDILTIGNQQRPDIFAMAINRDPSLASAVVEAIERIGKNGEVNRNIETKTLEKSILNFKKQGIDSVAISLLNATKNPFHEQKVTEICRKAGFTYISVSSGLSGMIKLLERTETTVVNAYLSPIIHEYLSDIIGQVGADNLRVMTSAGGLVKASAFEPMESLLSGPAGGVVGATHVGLQAGAHKLITFDMGGTSTDVSLYVGKFDYTYSVKVGNAHIMSPAITIETVAAGGGSICGFDGFRLFVGPESASAEPGPACYGAGGPLTVTDINLLAGKLHPGNFSIPVYREAAEHKLNQLLDEIEKASGKEPVAGEILESYLAIANETMAGAIRKISVSRGYDPADYCLVTFGGAGGLHACNIASLLGVRKIILPREAGLLSAYGIGRARIERFAEKQILRPLQVIKSQLASLFESLEEEVADNLAGEGIDRKTMEIRSRKIFLRFSGQDTSLEIEFTGSKDIAPEFYKKYESIYGHSVDNRDIEVEAIRIIASDPGPSGRKVDPAKTAKEAKPFDFIHNHCPVYRLDDMDPGCTIEGPALLLDNFSTAFLEKGWKYGMDSDRSGIIIPDEQDSDQSKMKRPPEAELELFTNRFMSIAEHMGAMLQRTAFSVNIKERLDFSCALLDAKGNLVANAPHIPVHLGGLSVCVRTLLEKIIFRPGDTVVTNHPAFGGSHLPDVTTVTPVFDDSETLAGFVVNRAHHSEIGGISPGSMPPSARNLAEEGVVIPPFHLVENGKANWDGILDILKHAPYPSRNPGENMADLNAALAANQKGKEALLDLLRTYGTSYVTGYFDALRNYAAGRMKMTMKKIPDGLYQAEEFLDDNSRISVRIEKNKELCRFDFSGSAPVHPSNMNATPAIVHSVVIYVLRLLLGEPVPLNDGLLEPVEIIIPEGMLNPGFPDDPFACPAVVGGNVEISQRLTDTILKAFGTMAASQGTMNNVLFGNDRFGYYETLAGGTGAGNGFDGADAVHHHMTNTRITDPEVLEHRYPVRLIKTGIREHSGGKGKWKGGNGLIRIYEFLEPVNLSLLTQRRQSGPYGMAGGESGMPGEQYIEKFNGRKIRLKGVDNLDLEPGDRLIIHTPGGGGYGPIKN